MQCHKGEILLQFYNSFYNQIRQNIIYFLSCVYLQEFFQKDAMRLPELDGVLYLKEGKRSWKKHYFVLRASGIYYTPKGKTKVGFHN